MKRSVQRAAVGLCIALSVCAQAAPTKSRELTNEAGQVVRDASGTRHNFIRHELHQRLSAAGVRSAATEPRARRGLTRHDWAYTAFGSGIGATGILSAKNGRATELYLAGSPQTFGPDTYWYALAWDARKGQFDIEFASETFSSAIVRMALAKVPDGKLQILVGLADGTLIRYDQRNRRVLSNTAGSCATRGGLAGFTTADLDGNGGDEIISVCADRTLVVEGSGYAGWTLAGVDGTEVVVGQMDGDAALEIATTSGRVIDSVTHVIEWFRPDGFGVHLAVGDIDGDGRDELIAAEAWYNIWAFDVDTRLPKWSISADLDIGAIRLADIDGDGTNDLLVGDGQWGSITAYDVVTLQEKGSIGNPEHGVTQIAVVDLDGRGTARLLWGAGYTSTGSDHLYVADWARKRIVWQNPDLTGPFIGPLVGDLDGDGQPELVFASAMSESGYDSGRIIVLDGRTLKVRAISAGVAGGMFGWTGIHDLKLRDIDGDGRLEILVGTDWLYDGVIEAYSFAADNQFSLKWTNTARVYGAPFMSIEVADVDGDGVAEVLGGVGAAHSGQQGTYVYVYDATTGAEKWHTPFTLGSFVTGLTVGDFDGDGVAELAVAPAGGDVWVFSGVTHAAEAQAGISGASSLTKLAPPAGSSLPRFVVGRSDGTASVRMFDGGAAYPESAAYTFSPARIDGIVPALDGTWFVGSGGVLRRFDGAQKLMETAAYGGAFGRDTAWLPDATTKVFACGLAGCFRFSLPRR